MNRIISLILKTLALLIFTIQPIYAQKNIVVIMVDDLSVNAMNVLIAEGLLPNIQTYLIDEGITFENTFVTNAVCCPSRATFLTGKYSHNHGVLSNLSKDPFKSGISWPGWFSTATVAGQNESTIATWLNQVGYQTGFIGKYLNGYGKQAPEGVSNPETYIPPGWGSWQGLIDPTTYMVYDYKINENGIVVQYGSTDAEYQTDVLAGKATSFINSASSPFLLMVTPLAPHIEIGLEISNVSGSNNESIDSTDSILNLMNSTRGSELTTSTDSSNGLTAILGSTDYRNGFKGQIRPAPRHAYLIDNDVTNSEIPNLPSVVSFNEANMDDKPRCNSYPPLPGITYNKQPNCVGDRDEFRPGIDVINVNNQYKSMLASVISVDDLVGDVITTLKNNNQLDNTLIIFISDNGWLYGEHRLLGKTLAYEESIRVPLLIRAPWLTSGGKTVSKPVLNNDIAPTIAEVAGIIPASELDGASLVPLLSNPLTSAWHRKGFLVEHWFIPSLLKFEMASFSAFRHIDSHLDFLYVAWRTDPANPQTVTHREFYHHDKDPYQISSINLLPNTTSIFEFIINKFRTCQGETCRQLEAL